MITYTNDLDMTPGGVPVTVHLSQYDQDFALVFNLTASQGAFTVSSGTTAAVRGTKYDGKGFSAYASISGTRVTVTGNKQMTAAAGRNIFELTLYYNGKELNTANFIVDVERAALDADTVVSDSQIREIAEIASSADEFIASLDAHISSAQAVKTALDGSASDAEQLKTNLDASNDAAESTKTALDASTLNAGTAKTTLDGSITAAGTTKTSLDASNTAAQATLESLEAEDATAVENIAALSAINFDPVAMTENVSDLRAYLGMYDNRVLGVQVDYENKTYTRLAGANNLSAGTDFDAYSMFGGRIRCNVSDDGTITAWYGDANYKDDGSNGQVMVYQPKFYYLVCPVVYDPIDTGIGYHLRKANYYVSEKAMAGFRLHPAFYDAEGNEIEYYLTSAYEGSIYDTSASAYLMNDEQVMTVSADKFCSIAGAKPASGLTQNLTRPNIETMAQNRGTNWHGDLIKQVSAEQLLMIIEMGMMNLQTAIANGVVSISDNSSYNCSSLTGSTASLGNGTGQAASTINKKGGTTTTETTNGKTSICWRGKENFWGNIWKFVYGINIWGNGAMGGGQPFICTDFNFAESKNSGNYEGAGFTVTNADGYISAMGYGGEEYDWLFFASECLGNSSVPVGDYHYITPNLNGYRIALLGCGCDGGGRAGAFSLYLDNSVGGRYRYAGGRLVYIPTRDSAAYTAAIASWNQQMAA